MRITIAFIAGITPALAGAFAATPAHADSFAKNNADRANELIAAVVKAHGGTAGLDSLKTLVVENEDLNHAVGQSRRAEPPWDTNESSGFNAIDLDGRQFVTEATFEGGGFEGRNGTIVNAAESYQLDFRAGTVAPIAEPDFATTSGPFIRVTPALLVRTLQDRAANAFFLGEVSISGADYDVIGFSMEVGPAISLYFDRKSHLLRRSERVLPGVGLVRYDFADYQTVAGIPFNRRFRLYLNGELNIERSNQSIEVNVPLDELLTVATGLQPIPAVEPDPLSRQEVAEGVWLVGGTGTYAMFVDMGDWLFAAGGTAGIPERIASVREVAGDKPLEYGMLTHHHFDHVLGVAAYESEGATVITAEAHEAVARDSAGDGESVRIKTVDDRMTLEGGGRTIEIIDIGPTAHSEHLLVAWLPEEGILFEADHFAMPRVGPVPPAVTSTRTFAEALRRHELVPKQLLSAHSPKIGTLADLESALATEPFQARR